MIEIKNLTMKYKNGKGVSDISLSVQDGVVTGLLGPNGSGKSTIMRSFMGLLNFSNGNCFANDINTVSNSIEAKNIIGYLPGDPHLPQNLSSRFLFSIASKLRSHSIDYALELAEKFDLNPDIKMKELSRGNKQKSALILAFLHKPKVIILDEPTSGLDPFHQRTFFELIEEYAKQGASILVSSHIVTEIEKIASSIAVLKDGKKVYDETMETFIKSANDDGQEIEDAFFAFYDKELK